MRSAYSIAFLITLIFASAYMFTLLAAVCKVPVTYRIGELDPRFNISLEEARVAVADAESVWEQATGRNLFTYDPAGTLVVNFIFDERQAFSDAEDNFRDQLSEAEDVNDEINDTYETLVTRYNALSSQYKSTVSKYEAKLAAYNAEVESYNQEGGAPPEAFAALEETRQELDQEAREINTLGNNLNTLVDEINRLSEEGNQLIEDYNEDVEQYNETFGESREFTQGDYQNGTINIYKFADRTELKLVLAHELGHALSLDHVTDETAIMHHLLSEQPDALRLTEDDLDEFELVCGRSSRSWIERLFILFNL